MVACWPLVPKLAGSNPVEAVGFFRAKENPQHAILRAENVIFFLLGDPSVSEFLVSTFRITVSVPSS